MVPRVVQAVHGAFCVALQLFELWLRLRSSTVQRKAALAQAQAFARLLSDLPSLVPPWSLRLKRKSERWEGRGIVVVAGGERYGALAITLVDSLRAAGCTLPVEVFHIGPEELASEAMGDLAARDGVTVRDLLGGQPTLREEAGFGYAAKPLALVASRFAEVLLLDADNYVLRDPSHLFDAPSYAETGALFWSDMYATAETFVRLHDPCGVCMCPSSLEQTVQDALDHYLITPVRRIYACVHVHMYACVHVCIPTRMRACTYAHMQVRIRADYSDALAAIGLHRGSLTQESGQVGSPSPSQSTHTKHPHKELSHQYACVCMV